MNFFMIMLNFKNFIIKKVFLFLIILTTFPSLQAQYVVNFEGTGETKTAYASGNVTLSGISWNMTEVLIGTDAADWKNGIRSTRMRGYGTSSMTMLADKPNGAGTISFQYRRYGTDTQVDWKVEYSINGGTNWNQIGSNFTAPATNDVQTFSATLNIAGNIRFRIKRATETGTANRRLNIDDFTITDYIVCIAPTTQASAFSFSSVQTDEMTVSWTNGNGSNRIVIMNTANSFTAPSDGTDPTANPVYGSGEQVVYNGSGNSVTVTGLSPSTTYWFRVYEYNCTGTAAVYNTSSATANPNSQITLAPPPTLSVNNSTLTGMNYVLGSGPSVQKTFNLSGSNLTGAPGNISITAPTNYEISTDNVNYHTSLSIPYASATLVSTQISVRLKAGLPSGNYNGEIITNSGGGASNVPVTCNGMVTLVPVSSTLQAGDLAILAFNTDVGSSGMDEISFVAFHDIVSGSYIDVTDNSYQKCGTPDGWGISEGWIRLQRTNSDLLAGTIVTVRVSGGTPSIFSPDPTNWVVSKPQPSGQGSFDMNNGGEQIFFMTDGDVGGPSANTATSDAGTYSGHFLFGFNTKGDVWTPLCANAAGGGTQNSDKPENFECFLTWPTAQADKNKYTGSLLPATQREWIDRINSPSNWSGYSDNTTYNSGPDFYGESIVIQSGGFTEGKWIGNVNSVWFDCSNWENMRVPDNSVNVIIPSSGVTNNPTIGDPTPYSQTSAYCNDLNIESGRILLMDHSGSNLEVSGDILISGTLTANAGLIKIIDDNSSLSASAPVSLYNLEIAKNSYANTLNLNNSVTVKNILYLTNGIITTNSNYIIISNPLTSTITGHDTQSYINGNLRRYVNSTGSYDFPVGTANFYELAQIVLNSSSGLNFINAAYHHPHTTTLNISPLNLFVNGNLLEELLDYGYWTLMPDAGIYNYDVILTSRGQSNPGPTAASHAVIKRPNASSSWVSEGNHNNSTQTSGTGWIQAKRSSLTVFSDFAIAKSNLGSLPVELISFNAILQNNDANLDWTTASEINNNYFQIERSENNISSFKEIGLVYGMGNSNIETNYNFTDINIPEKILYYRLKQVDYDGAYSYSNVISLDNGSVSGDLYISNILNDNNSLLCSIHNISGNFIDIDIYDITGKLIYTHEHSITESSYLLNITEYLPLGIYFLRVNDGIHSASLRFIR